MKPTLSMIAVLTLIAPRLSAQTARVEIKWAAIRRLETQPATHHRDTTLARAYADFVVELVKKEPADSGLIYTDKAYALAESRGWQAGILLALIRKASCLNIANRHYEAIRVGLKGLKLAEQQNDLYHQGLFHRSLGNNYDMLDNYGKAIPHYEACLRLSEQVPTLLRTRANALVELGDAYRFIRKRPDRAKTLIEQAIAIYRTIDSSSLGYAYDYYGQALTDLNLFRQAEESFTRADRYLAQSGKEYLMPELLLHKAELYVAERKYAKAIRQARVCLDYSVRKESRYGQRGAYRILYQSNKALGHLDSALANHEQFVVMNDAINETANSERFRAEQSDYALQTQQDTIAQLTISQQRQTQWLLLGSLVLLLLFSIHVFHNNRQLSQKNRAITSALLQGQTLERQRVAADLHDNLGSTLSALRWNLEAMDKTRLSAVEQTVYATISQQIGQAYTDVRLLSHNLLPDELAKQGLAVALQKLIDKMNRSTPVRFQLSGAHSLPRLDRQTEFELYSICLELLNNTIKHAQANQGHIEVSQANGNLRLTVADNGTGLNNQRSDGRGLQNVAARVDSIGGRWTAESTPGGGVQHRITVPVKMPVRVS